MARSLSNTNAGLYRCVPCKSDGATAYGSKRVRIGTPNVFGLPVPASGQRMIALCDTHTAAYDGARRVHRQDGAEAIVSAIVHTADMVTARRSEEETRDDMMRTMPEAEVRDILGMAKRKGGANYADAYAVLLDDYADRLAQRAVREGTSTLPTDVRDEIRRGLWAASVRANVDYTDTHGAAYTHGRTVVSLDATQDTSDVAGNSISVTLSHGIAETEQGTDSWDESVLALLDEADAATLRAYADRDEADARPATRSEPTQWAQGRMVPLSGADETVKAAALRYLEAKAYASLIGA